MPNHRLVVFGTSAILSDLFDAAIAQSVGIGRIVVNQEEELVPGEPSLADRLAALAPFGPVPEVVALAAFEPAAEERYLLGPTTPARRTLAAELTQRFGLSFTTLCHPTAYVSPLATLGAGCFVGANSVIAAGARLGPHVFINRGATVGHDTAIDGFSRVQPGANVGGLCRIGAGVTIGLGATVLERLAIGDGAFVGAGAVVLADVPADVLVVGVPAQIKKRLTPAA